MKWYCVLEDKIRITKLLSLSLCKDADGAASAGNDDNGNDNNNNDDKLS